MGEYRLKIGTSEFQKEIKDTQQWRQTMVRDFGDKIVRVRGDYKFTAFQGLYELIYTHLVTKGICTAMDAKVYYSEDHDSSFDYIFKGQIKPQDGEIDLINLSCDIQLLEDVWAARINNSQNQKVNLDSNRSKNDLPISPCTRQEISFYNPVDLSYFTDTRISYKVFDVFKFLLDYYTDGQATFESSFFEDGGDGDQYHITTGKEIRTHSGILNPAISFGDFFSEMDKKFNLFIVIGGTNENPVLKIERRSTTLIELPVLEVDNFEKAKVKTDLEQLYTVIKVGSSQTDYNIDEYASYPNVRFKSWNDEEYNTNGDCEFESRVLDLVSGYKIDSNSIEQALDIGGSDEDIFDDDIFIVEADSNGFAFQFTDDSTGVDTGILAFYNFNLNNENTIKRWFDGIPFEIAMNVEGRVWVNVYTVNQIGLMSKKNDVIFENDNTFPAFDPDNIYTTPTENPSKEGEFYIKNASVYNVTAFCYIENQSISFNSVAYSIYATVYDVGRLNVLYEYRISDWGITTLLEREVGLLGSSSIYIPENSVLVIRVHSTKGGSWKYDITSGFAFVLGAETSIDGDESEGFKDPLVFIYNFEKFKLPISSWQTIKDNPYNQVRFMENSTGRYWDVWPKEVSYDYETQQVTTGEFIGRSPLNAQQDLCWILQTGNWNDDCYWIDSETWKD